MVSMFVKSIRQSVFSVGKPWPRVPWFLSSHSSGIPSIMVGAFIVLEKHFSVIRVMTRTFIKLDGPPKAGEGITIIIKGCTPAETVSGISCPMGVPPNPPNKVAVSTIATHVNDF